MRPPVVLTALLAVLALSLPAAATQATLQVDRHAGATRTATAAAVAAHTHPGGAATVVLARADVYADALVAAPLAASLDAPILLTGPAALDPAAADAMAALAPEEVVAIGELDAAVLDAVHATGATSRHLTGEGSFGVAAAVAREVVSRTGATTGLLVEGQHADPGRGWPDALAASAWAAATARPVLLTTAGALPDPTAEVIADLAAVTVVGGTAAVSDEVADAAGRLTGSPADRVAGADRYATAVAVATRVTDDGRTTARPEVWVASGRAWPDALVAGPAVARAGGVLLLADPASLAASPATLADLDRRRSTGPAVHLVGGTAAISQATADGIATGQVPAPGDAAPGGTPTGGEPTHDEAIPGADQRPPATGPRNAAPPIEGALPWSDPATWGGRLPQAGEVVTIPADQAILLDTSPPALTGIQVDGTLVAADRDLSLQVGWIAVRGRLAIGTAAQPITHDVTVTLDPQVPGAAATGAGDGAIAVQGGTLDLHGITPDQPWTRLATTATAGSSTLALQQPPGWRVGDEVVIASTTTDVDQAEVRRVVASSGTTVQLDRPLAHTHWGQTDTVGGVAVPMHAEVASLTRTVEITSTDAARSARRGGHVIAFEGSLVRISGTELDGLGQAGEVARYPIHFHLMGSASGSYVRGASIHHSANRCVTLHGTDHVEVAETVGYEASGHCFFLEDGVESGNSLWCNLGLSTRAPAEEDRILDSDATPATFWITNPTNHLARNAAAGSEGHGFWFDLPEAPTGLSAGTDLDIRSLPLGTFDDNVAHTTEGSWKDAVGIFVEDHEPPTESVMRRNAAYANSSFGAWIEGATLQGGVLAANGIGFLGTPGRLTGAGVVGDVPSAAARDQWRLTGVGVYHRRSDLVDVAFAGYGARTHSWQHPAAAIEVISDEMNEVSEVRGARFAADVATRLVVVQPDSDDGPDLRAHAIRDVDGSISGAPTLLASAHPLLLGDGCTWRADLRANSCPVDLDRAWLRITDQAGDPGAVALARPDGVTAPLDGPRWADEASGDVLLDRTYQVRTERPLSGSVELILAGGVEGYVDLELPWPHPTAHVYDGWGRWHAVEPGDATMGWSLAGGVLRVRHTLDDVASKGGWQRLEVCAVAFCGEPGPG